MTRPGLARLLAAEALGAALLVAAVVGSGIMATALTEDVGLALLVNAVSTVAALGVLIWTLGPTSGAHFNPAVTLTAAVRREVSRSEAGGYVVAQLVGASGGEQIPPPAMLYVHNQLFGLQDANVVAHG